jgi:hypothetical protein
MERVDAGLSPSIVRSEASLIENDPLVLTQASVVAFISNQRSFLGKSRWIDSHELLKPR